MDGPAAKTLKRDSLKETDMNTPSQKIVFCIALVMLFGQQTVFADYRPNLHRDTRNNHWKAVPAPHSYQFDQRFDRHRQAPPPSYKQYYKPGYRVNPLPYGHSRIFVNNAEYFFFDGYFYRPSPSGYVIVEAPIGAIVLSLPRLHQFVHWRGQPYYIVGNTFYRRHPRGYVVVPDPGFGYRR
jgi:hypothetical protein